MIKCDGRIVYVSCAASKDIAILERSVSGALREISRIGVEGDNGEMTSLPLALSSDRKTLYAALRSPPFPVYRFAVDPGSGALTLRGRFELPAQPAYIAADPSERFLLCASYYGSSICALQLQHGSCGKSSISILPGYEKAHSVCFDPAGRFFYVGVLGGNQIAQMRFDAERGELIPVSRLHTKAGTGPRHITFDAKGRFLYAVNEVNATVGAYAIDAATGNLAELHTLPLLPGNTAARLAADVHVTPDGRFLYASVRDPASISCFAINCETGRLTYIETVESEPVPRGFAITPDGTQLIAPGQKIDKVAVFSINQTSGRLIRDHALTLRLTGRPSWILML